MSYDCWDIQAQRTKTLLLKEIHYGSLFIRTIQHYNIQYKHLVLHCWLSNNLKLLAYNLWNAVNFCPQKCYVKVNVAKVNLAHIVLPSTVDIEFVRSTANSNRAINTVMLFSLKHNRLYAYLKGWWDAFFKSFYNVSEVCYNLSMFFYLYLFFFFKNSDLNALLEGVCLLWDSM